MFASSFYVMVVMGLMVVERAAKGPLEISKGWDELSSKLNIYVKCIDVGCVVTLSAPGVVRGTVCTCTYKVGNRGSTTF